MDNQSSLNSRQKEILNYLKDKQEVKVNELINCFNVAGMTIRRDLEKFEKIGIARRTYGGAIYTPQHTKSNVDTLFTQREMLNQRAKESIGRVAATYVEEGDFIFVDAGTTASHLVKYLPEDLNITIVTNAVNIMTELINPNVEKILIGGLFRETTLSLVGPLAENALDNLYFNKAFLSASGFTKEDGFSNSNNFEVQIKRKVMENSKEVNYLVDSSKYNQQFLHRISSLKSADRIFTDTSLYSEELNRLSDLGVEMVLCE